MHEPLAIAAVTPLACLTGYLRRSAMPPRSAPRVRSRSRVPPAALGSDIRVALRRGGESRLSLLDLTPAQEVAIAECSRALLVTAKQAWEQSGSEPASLLVIANLSLLPATFRAAFSLPSPEDPGLDAASLRPCVRDLLALALTFHDQQASLWNQTAPMQASTFSTSM